jgi:hypothetical protein
VAETQDRWPPSIVKIEAGPQGKESKGTGALVAPQYILTALHVITDKEGEEPKEGIEVRLYFGTEEEIPKRATPIKWSTKDDWVLLQCNEVPAGLSEFSLVDISTKVSKGERFSWVSFGFPVSRPSGWHFNGSLDGWVEYPETKTQSFQLTSEAVRHIRDAFRAEGFTKPQSKHRIQGVSGAPILVDGSVVAVMRSHLSDLVAGTLYATPLSKILPEVKGLLTPILQVEVKPEGKQTMSFLDAAPPLDHGSEKVKGLHKILRQAYDDSERARNFIRATLTDDDVADIDFRGPPSLVWWRILDTACAVGKLKKLVDKVLADTSIAGFHPGIKALLLPQ